MVSTDRRYGVNSAAGWKNPVRVASTANLTLSGEQTIDGVAAVADDRVFAKDQDDATEIGIYVVSTGAWTRDADWDGTYDIVQHTLIPVVLGTANAGTWWRVTNTSVVVGTTSVTLEEVAYRTSNSITMADGSADLGITIFQPIGVITEDTYESIGPTGSGADNIWDALDLVPTTARFIIINLYMRLVAAGTANAEQRVWFAPGGVTAVKTYEQVAAEIETATIANDGCGYRHQLIIPCDSNQVFQLLWEREQVTGSDLDLSYVGYIS